MDEKAKPDMEGGDVVLLTSTENDNSTDADDEYPSYSSDAAGMNKAYRDIQQIFAEVIRDYPEEFYPDEAERKREENAAGDAGFMDTEPVPDSEPANESLKNDKMILGLIPGSVPNFLSSTQSSLAHQREKQAVSTSAIPPRSRSSKSRSKEPTVKKPWWQDNEPGQNTKRVLPTTLSKSDKKPNALPPAPIKSIFKKQVLPTTLGKGTKKDGSSGPEESSAPSHHRVRFEERPSIKKVDLRPIEPSDESERSATKIISRRTDPVPDFTDEAISISSELDEIVTYRMETPLESLWPIKVTVRGNSLTSIKDIAEGGDQLSGPTIEKDQESATEHESGYTKVETLPTRINTVLENVPHDAFAAEFIKDAGIQSDKAIIESMTVEYRAPPPPPREKPGTKKIEQLGLTDREVQTSIKIVYTPPIWPHHMPLYTTLSKLPSLRSVVLDDSKVRWLRELGSSLPNLVTLSVMRCGLLSLDGTSAFPNLENLFVADNKINNPSQLSVLRNLRFVDLSDNPIDTFEGFAFLKLCTNLRCIKLMETEVSRYASFHISMRRLIPSLRELQPKSVALHGPGVYDLYRNELDDEDDEDFDDDPESVLNPFSALRSVPRTKEEQGFSRVMHRSTGLKWREQERRIRDAIYNPDRQLFRKRAVEGVGVPMNVDEMDAYLDDLESTSDLPVRESLETDSNIIMTPLSEAAEASMSASNRSLLTISGYTDTTSGVGAEDTVSTRSTGGSPSETMTTTTEEFNDE